MEKEALRESTKITHSEVLWNIRAILDERKDVAEETVDGLLDTLDLIEYQLERVHMREKWNSVYPPDDD